MSLFKYRQIEFDLARVSAQGETLLSGIDSKTIAFIAIVIAIIALGYGFISPGPAGPEGLEGPEGPQGPPGEQGPTGPQGPGVTPDEISEVVEEQLTEQLAENLQIPIEIAVEPNRGCPSCHVLIDPEDGKYTLSYEAHERVTARRGTDIHPNMAPDGTDISPTSETGVETCLQCHAPNPDTGRGIVAPLALRDIVHPAHMGSQWFKLHYSGNCFTCHNINAEGEFELLTEAVTTNEKGVPDPTQIPIPGAIELHEHAQVMSLMMGGQLYDKWWTVASGASEPTEDQALWSTQTTNTRSGSTTWRCKECHGWDYKGADGAYSSGSHYTGFTGVFEAMTKSVSEVLDILKGGVNPDHDFSTAMDDDALMDLAEFITEGGVVDVSVYINSDKTISGADTGHGNELYNTVCYICHGADGKTLDFGDGEYVGTLSNDNPWEILHKIRFGQPGTAMPSSEDIGWSIQDAVDVLDYCQTLPEE